MSITGRAPKIAKGSLDGPSRRNCKCVLEQVVPYGHYHKLEHDHLLFSALFVVVFVVADSKYIFHCSVGAFINGTKKKHTLISQRSLRGNITNNTKKLAIATTTGIAVTNEST